MIVRFVLLILGVCCSGLLLAQDNSNKGKEFWIAYPAHIDGSSSVMGIYITSDVNTTGKIQVGTTTSLDINIIANEVTRIFLGGANTASNASNSDVYLNMTDGVKTGGAIKVTTVQPVVVYSHIIRSARSGASLVLPTPVLGNEYIVPSYGSVSTSGPGMGTNGSRGGIGIIAVIATQANTTIEITPTANGLTRSAAPFQVTLPNAGDVYQFQSAESADLSGSKVRSIASGGTGGCKPIAVYSATTWTALDCTGASGGDNLYQQLFPTRSWGKKFVTAPFINRTYDIYRIYVTNPSTKVRVTDNGISSQLTTAMFNATGNYYTYKTARPLEFEGDAPISVVQYMISQTCNTGCNTNNAPQNCLSDPEMVILSPVEQTLDKITFFSAHSTYVPANQTAVSRHYVNIIIGKNHKGSVKIDNAAPAGSFIDIPGTNYAYLQEDLTTSSAQNPVHRVSADSSFSAIVYGYGNVESYGYNGGTNVKDFSASISFANQFKRIDSAVACINTPSQFAVPLNYLPSTLKWNFSAAPGVTPNTEIAVSGTPVPDSTVLRNGQPFYYFSPGTSFTFSTVSTSAKTDTIKIFTTSATPDGCGSTEQTIVIPIKVNLKPSADFSWTGSGCASGITSFTTPALSGGRWLWNMGNGSQLDLTTPTHDVRFGTAGNYLVKLSAISDIGCASDEVSKTVSLTAKPNASFTYSAIRCVDTDIQFTDASTTASGSIAKWTWNLDNGAGSYTVTTNAVQTTRYATTGSRRVSLIVETQTGCKSDEYTPTSPVVVNPSPQPGFILPEVCLNDASARFTDTSKIADGSEAQFQYLWTFNAGTPAISPGPNVPTSTVKNPAVKYNKADVYTVTQRVTSKDGCAATATQQFTVNGSVPKADFSVETAVPLCSKFPVVIKDLSTVDFGNVTRSEIYWDRVNQPNQLVNDDNPSPNKLYSHSYAVNGSSGVPYNIRFVAYSGGSTCVSELTKTVTVYPSPTASYTASKTAICFGETVQFTDQSGNTSPAPLVRWVWDLGLNTTSSIQNPLKQYRDSGTFITSLHGYSQDGCVSDTAKVTIAVNPLPVLTMGTKSYTVLEGGQANLSPAFVYANSPSFQWTPPMYLSSTSTFSTVTIPLSDITYTFQVTSLEGCSASDQITVKVLKSPEIPNAFSPNGDGVNDTWNIKYLESYPGAVIEVFNRYGQIVYRATGYSRPWDGTTNGKLLPIGTYYYIINPKNGRQPLNGSITIIR